MEVRRQIDVSGIVQGVGFRPYVYRLATGRHLKGTIRNTSAGVTIEIQGPAETVRDFVEHLPAEAPSLARITSLAVHDVVCNGDQDFRIVHSREGEEVRTLISPDVAICPDCLREMFDSNDRRYRYPFINCTNCGPRFTIIRDIPYDRPSTSMAVFPMCPACQAEYENPLNRRFHAQPNACWECGPRVELWDKSGTADRMPRSHRRSGFRPARGTGRSGEGTGRISSGGRCDESRGGSSAAPAQAPRGKAVRRDGSGSCRLQKKSVNWIMRRARFCSRSSGLSFCCRSSPEKRPA